MIIVRLLSPEPVGWLKHHQLYSGLGADIVMESISLIAGWPTLCVFEAWGTAHAKIHSHAVTSNLVYSNPIHSSWFQIATRLLDNRKGKARNEKRAK